jgi:hypothetical protein
MAISPPFCHATTTMVKTDFPRWRMKSTQYSRSSTPPLPRALAALASCLTILGILCLIKNGHLGAITLQIGLASIACALLVIGLMLWLEYRRAPQLFNGLLTPRASAAQLFENLTAWPLPRHGQVLILIQGSYAKRIRRSVWLAFGIAIVLVISIPIVGGGPSAAHETQQAALLRKFVNFEFGVSASLFLVSGILSFFFLRKLLKSRIGIDALGLLYDDGGGEVQRYDWSAILTDRNSLLIGSHMVRLTPNGRSGADGRFAADPLRGYILARLPAASYVSHYRLVWAAACRSTFATRMWYGSAFAVFVLAEYLQLHPKLASPVRQAFVDWLSR